MGVKCEHGSMERSGSRAESRNAANSMSNRVVTDTPSTFSRASIETNSTLSHALTSKDRLFIMGDNATPADGVAQGLVSYLHCQRGLDPDFMQLPHLHLISTHKYPILAHMKLENVVQYLLEAPRITRESAGMSWVFLPEPPADGTVMLVWQPPQLGSHMASDGYVWADAEQPFSSAEGRGYVRHSTTLLIRSSPI